MPIKEKDLSEDQRNLEHAKQQWEAINVVPEPDEEPESHEHYIAPKNIFALAANSQKKAQAKNKKDWMENIIVRQNALNIQRTQLMQLASKNRGGGGAGHGM